MKSVFDDPVFDSSDTKSSLKNICINALDDSEIEFWRRAFIKYEDLFKYCNQGFVSFNEKEIILLSESQRNHYQCELYTKVLEFELSNEMDQIHPFTSVNYKPVKSREEYAGVVIGGWHFNKEEYSIHIGHYDNVFYMWFNRKGSTMFSEQLANALTRQGFKPKVSESNSSDEIDCFENVELHELEDVKSSISNLCAELMELIDK